jgi:hypothetical protein
MPAMTDSEENQERAGTMVSARRKKTSDLPHMPEFGKAGYLAATDDEVSLARAKSGLLKLSVTDEVVARLPRDELEEIELEERRGFARLRLTWQGARLWEFDIAGAHRRSARAFVEALGGRIGGSDAEPAPEPDPGPETPAP